MSTKRARVDGSMEFPDQTDRRNLTTCITLNSSNRDDTTALNLLNGEFSFALPPSFSIYRNKACSIKVVSASVAYDTNDAAYNSQATAIDLATNIPVQGLCNNFPTSNSLAVVQASLQIPTIANTDGQNMQVFSATSPDSCLFRCQSLPDKITLFMLRTRAAAPISIQKFTPNHASMILQIDFDEPI
tara:strand:- start:714 stop:1274 length:561 start_codon:yes stop_codon:yes gene_type:complete